MSSAVLKVKVSRLSPEAPALKLTLTPDKYKANKRDVVRYYDHPELPNARIELKEVIKFIARDDAKAKIPLQGGDFINFLPTKKLPGVS